MSNITKNRNPLSDRPLKTSQATGSVLASMGLEGCIPFMHGAQGCCAFAKVYLIQHFREPFPIQNTGMDQISSVMGGDENLISGLELLCERHSPKLISIMTTGLTELQGTDNQRVIREFRQKNPQFDSIEIITSSTPDFTGSAQSGFALTIENTVKNLASTNFEPGLTIKNNNKINLFASMALTPADGDYLMDTCREFGLTPVLIPNLASSLDGHLDSDSFSPTSSGGTALKDIQHILSAGSNIIIGDSLAGVAKWLKKHQAPVYQFSHLMNLEQNDAFISLLQKITGNPVSARIAQARKRYLDTLLDTHFYLSGVKLASALESDLTMGYSALCHDIGIEHHRAVTGTSSAGLKEMNCTDVIVGDHSDLDDIADQVNLIIGNSHCANFFDEITPVFRAGYPCHDRLGAADQLQIGYQGCRSLLQQLTNLILARKTHEVASYKSPYAFDSVNSNRIIPDSVSNVSVASPENGVLTHA